MLGIAGGAFLPELHLPTGLFVVTAVIGGIGVMFAEVFRHLLEGHRPLIEGGIATYAIQAFFELFEAVITYVSNSLSYIRVGAFAVAHGGLSSVFFILAALVSPTHGVGYWIMLLIGNIFIVGFEGLIVAIQTMRLHYYEFLGKFFTGGGMRFEPFLAVNNVFDRRYVGSANINGAFGRVLEPAAGRNGYVGLEMGWTRR